MRTAGHYERVLTAFRNEEVDILLGTQMIAKGLDFPNVQLVGVISADTARNIPDFRACRKHFNSSCKLRVGPVGVETLALSSYRHSIPKTPRF